MSGAIESAPDFHSLHGLDTHHGCPDSRIQAAIPMNVAAQANWYIVANYFKNAADSVSIFFGFVNPFNHLLLGSFVQTAHRGVIRAIVYIFQWNNDLSVP